MALTDLTHYRIICRNAALYRDKTAWYEAETDRTVSFAEFRELTDRLAASVKALGLEKGDRIGVLGKNSLDYALVYGAAAALGLVMLPINWRLSAEEVRFNLDDGGVKIIFADHEFAPTIDRIRSEIPSLRHVYALAGQASGQNDLAPLSVSNVPFIAEEIEATSDFVIIHTAAVAGRPRGALLSHSNLLFANLEFIRAMDLDAADVHLNVLPLFHVGGLCTMMSCFHAGAACLNLTKFDAQTATRLIAEKKATVMFDFAPILGAILDQGEKDGVDISSLSKIIGLDSAETIARYQETTGGSFYSFFGQTETSCITTVDRYNECPGSAGRPVPAAEVELVDEDDRPVDKGATGEIIVRGPLVFKGYINLPEDTAHTFRGGWHHTGDLGRFDQDGFLHYMGRKAEKELIKPGGENVYPAEVENAILQHPAILATVVFGVPDPKWKEGIKAVCELRPGGRLTAGELIDFVGERIARYKKPQYVQFVDELPRLPGGAIDRRKTKELYGPTA